MADARNRFTIKVDISQDGNGKFTTPRRQAKDTKIDRSFTDKILANKITTASAASAVSIGKTYINLEYSKSEQILKKDRFNLGFKLATYVGGGSLLGPAGTVAGTIAAGASIVNDVMSYNTDLEKRQLRFDYTNEKFRQYSAGGSRFGGGDL